MTSTYSPNDDTVVQIWRHNPSGCLYGVLMTREGRVLAMTAELTQAEAIPENMPHFEFDNSDVAGIDPSGYSLVEFD